MKTVEETCILNERYEKYCTGIKFDDEYCYNPHGSIFCAKTLGTDIFHHQELICDVCLEKFLISTLYKLNFKN